MRRYKSARLSRRHEVTVPVTDQLLSYRISKNVGTQQVTEAVLCAFKYGFLAEARVLARETDSDYMILLTFAEMHQQNAARENIEANRPEYLVPMNTSDRTGWVPLSRVLPSAVNDVVIAAAASDADLKEYNLQGIASRMEAGRDFGGEYLIPDLPDEVYDALKRKEKKPS